MDLTLIGQVLGSPNFMAPEQAEGRHADIGPASDVYSLGAILYQALTGRPPFQGETLTEVLQQVVNADPVAPRQLNPSIPRDLETLCLRCLEKEPGRRLGSAQALADELARFRAGKPILARPIGPMGRVGRWSRRKPLVAGLGIALAVVFAIGFGGVVWQWREAKKQLWGSYLAQARANRWSGQAGRRYASLEVLRQAAAIRPSLELRNEAIACFTLTDARVIQQWQTATGSMVVFDPDCERFAYWNPPAGLAICRVADGTELLRLPGGDGLLPVKRLGFSPNGELLAVAAGSPESFRIQVWGLPQREVQYEAVLGGSRQPMAFSPDSRLLLVGDTHGMLHVFDIVGKQKVKELQVMRSPAQIVFDPGGSRIAISSVLNRDIQIIDFDTGMILKTLTHPEPAGEPSWHPDTLMLRIGPPQTLVSTVLEQARWALDGRSLAVTSPEGIQRLELGPPLRVLHRGDHPNATFLSLSDDGHWVATGTWKGQGVRVWNVDTGSLVTNLSVGGNVAVAFSPQSRWLVTAAPREYRFWKVGSWEIAHAIPRENAGDMYGSMVFSPDGGTLVTDILHNPLVSGP